MGQINNASMFGSMITRIVSDEKYTTVCEIGAWNGQGSTVCVMDALKIRQTPFTFFSLEANHIFFNKAVDFWKPCPLELKLIYGSLHNKIMSRNEVESHSLFLKIKDHYDLWYEDEKNSCLQSPIVTLPVSQVDIVILDGGEFSSQGDWEVLQKMNPKIVILDDTQGIKNYQLRKYLLDSTDWEIVFDIQHERNGWSIFRHRE